MENIEKGQNQQNVKIMTDTDLALHNLRLPEHDGATYFALAKPILIKYRI